MWLLITFWPPLFARLIGRKKYEVACMHEGGRKKKGEIFYCIATSIAVTGWHNGIMKKEVKKKKWKTLLFVA